MSTVDELVAACQVLLEEWDAHDIEQLDRVMRDLRVILVDLEVTTEYSAELISRGRHTGVIVAVDRDCTPDWAVAVREQLEIRFPEVRFAVVPGATSLAFEWDDPEVES